MNLRVKLGRSKLLRLLDGGPVQHPTPVGLLEFEAEADPEWQPLREVSVKPEIRALYEATMGENPVEVWRNDLYEVIVRRMENAQQDGVEIVPPGGVHMSIKRYDRAPLRNWRHMQQMKNEIAGPEREALELFPRESRMVDNANQFHLWVLPEGMDVPVGFEAGMVVIDPEEVAEYNAMTPSGRQEPMQPGVTTGTTVNDAAHATGASSEALQFMRDLKEGGLIGE